MPTIKQLRDELEGMGLKAIIPLPDDLPLTATTAQVDARKREASMEHFRVIQNEETTAVLVVNPDKEGVHDYIGPNSFAEIAVAVAARRQVFLFQGIPAQYRDELKAWGAEVLNGDVSGLRRLLRGDRRALVDA